MRFSIKQFAQILPPAPIVFILLTAALGACATDAPSDPTEQPLLFSVALEAGALGPSMRTLAQASGGNIAVMNGLEGLEAPALKFESRSFESAARELAAAVNCEVIDAGDYFFVTASGYEELSGAILGPLNAVSESRRVDVAYGAGTRLYSALALLGRASDTTIVADNVVANARCGDLHLRDVTVREAADALLRSARIARGRIRVRSAEDYVLIASADTVSRAEVLLNAATLDTGLEPVLRRIVSVSLPASKGGGGESLTRAAYLDDVREALSAQLGVAVQVPADMRALPVNPVVMNGVSLRTALELLIHQWPVPEFGYTLTGDGVAFRRLR